MSKALLALYKHLFIIIIIIIIIIINNISAKRTKCHKICKPSLLNYTS